MSFFENPEVIRRDASGKWYGQPRCAFASLRGRRGQRSQRPDDAGGSAGGPRDPPS